MDNKLFESEIKKLSHAFRCDIPAHQTLKIYWEYIGHLNDEDFVKICDKIIKNERFFPAISVFLKLHDETPEWF